jgi:hypothetical protein
MIAIQENHQNGRGENRKKGIIIQSQVNHQHGPGHHREKGLQFRKTIKMAVAKTERKELLFRVR